MFVSAKGTINKLPDVISAVDSTAQQFKEMKTNCIYQLISLELRRLRSIVVIKCSSLLSYNTLTWTLIVTIRNYTPEYLTGTGELFSEVDRNVVCCDYDRPILGGSFLLCYIISEVSLFKINRDHQSFC